MKTYRVHMGGDDLADVDFVLYTDHLDAVQDLLAACRTAAYHLRRAGCIEAAKAVEAAIAKAEGQDES